MLVNEAWLKEFVNYSMPTSELAEKLTMAGLEIDSIEPAAAKFSGVVVGEVTEVAKHPNADKLRVCKVNVAADELLDIVCGASNVRQGLRVAVATVGAVLPGDFKIKKSKLRGEPSHGMLCSEQELGLLDSANGIMELAVDAPIGEDIRSYLKLEDTVIEVDLTPNRADCLSVEGIAREISCFDDVTVNKMVAESATVSIDNTKNILVEATADCPRYLGRVIKGLDANAATPLWMQEKLRRCGQRSLGLLVDVTNFVLLELGQPLHAFDANKVDGSIVIRRAQKGESLTLLNDQKVKLDQSLLVIADDNKPLALAGIMGGQSSAVSDQTTEIFLESAFFQPLVIAGKARKFGLHTDASHRFERGVDPQLALRALERASTLLVELAGGQVGPVIDVTSSAELPKNSAVELRLSRVKRVLGLDLDPTTIESYLNKLSMAYTSTDDGWLVTAASYRFDIAIEADLIEEVARLYGYDKLPQHSLTIHSKLVADKEQLQPVDRIKDLLVDLGYQEAITYSFTDEEVLKKLTPNATFYKLQNPISSDLSVMRTTLWAGLLKAVETNIKHTHETVRLFETGLKFNVVDGELQQQNMLAMAVTGLAQPEQWAGSSRKVDFFDIKNDLENIFKLNDCFDKVEFRSSTLESLHPGQTAELFNQQGQSLGFIGLLHPSLETELDINRPVYLVEVSLACLQDKAVPVFEPITKYPSVRRDIALIVNKELNVADLVSYINQQAGLVKDVLVFDVYQGKGLETATKSVGLGLILQDKSKTLVENEIEEQVQSLLVGLKEKFNAHLRD